MQKIEGSDMSCYKTIAIRVGQTKVEGINGKKSKYAVFFVKNKKSRLSKTEHLVIFDDQDPDLINTLLQYKTDDKKDENGRYEIDLSALKHSDDADELQDIFEWPGMQAETYKLRKGLCYQNDIDGKRVTKKDGSNVIVDTISVLVQIDYILDNNGKLDIHYFKPYDPDIQGPRMENTFYKEAVTTTASVTEPTPEPDSDDSEDAPF